MNQNQINKLKDEFIGKTFNQLTVLDIYLNDKTAWCICKCTCGTIKHIKFYTVKSGRNKSCGCAMSTESRSKKAKQYCANHPEKVAEQAVKYHEWCVNNPEKVKAKSEKVSKFYKEHPEVAKSNGEKVSRWCKENPDKLAERGKSYVKWCNNHPEELAKAGQKISKWHADNPDKVLEKSNKIKEHFKNNPDIVIKRNYRRSELSTIRRLESLSKLDLSFIHPEDLSLLMNGKINSRAKVRTKCPLCGMYDTHEVKNFINIAKCHVDTIPLCDKCHRDYYKSKGEQEIADFISTLYTGELVRNSRDIISPLELDLYYPDKKIAIEFNGDYWHDENHKPNDYHYNKFKRCCNLGIRLISIYEHEWLYNKEYAQRILNNTFMCNNKIYARQCSCIKLTTDNELKKFINDNCYYNIASFNDKIIYGLYYNNSLVMCSIYKNIINNEYELTDIIVKHNTIVIGGASKLFTYFVHNHLPSKVTSYSDNDIFTGNVFNKLGFIKNTDCIDNIISFSNNPSKIKQLNCEQIETPNKIYRCGKTLWIWELAKI